MSDDAKEYERDDTYRQLVLTCKAVTTPRRRRPRPYPIVANLRLVAPPPGSPEEAAFKKAFADALERAKRAERDGQDMSLYLLDGDLRIETEGAADYLDDA